jgi:glycosyltransferase involved in cell wall biosynthesis
MAMKRMLLILPHWPPSNLVGVHRVRLIANELYSLGWQATVLTIDERDYEEKLATETLQLVAPEIEVIKVRANPVKSFFGKRLVGDIGLRGWKPLRRRARTILAEGNVDFIWFSLPSWYPALMGRGLAKMYGVPFGIDYRDPWVYELASNKKGLNRATFTILAARILEPLALRSVSIVSGVSEGYVEGVKQRYPKLANVPFVTFQMGFSKRDHFINLPHFTPPFTGEKRTYVYAGAHWSMGAPLFSLWLRALAQLNKKTALNNVEFLFIGTGNPELPSLQGQAIKLGLNDVVREIPERLSYLEVQKILRESSGALVIGSVEPHYSASKLFQCLITAPRVFGFFHHESEGKQIMDNCQASDFYVPYHPLTEEDDLINALELGITAFIDPSHIWRADLAPLEVHSTQNAARKFIEAVEHVQY